MIVRESLSRFDLLDDGFLAENILNEKLDINLIANKAKRTGILAAMFLKFLLISGTGSTGITENPPEKKQIEQDPIILSLASQDNLTKDEIFTGFDSLWKKYMGQEEEVKEEKRIFSAADPGFIDAINMIKPGRLDTSKVARYDKYDDQILAAADKLNAKGENADPNLIKAMMIVETGMNPRKNSLGYRISSN